MTTTVKSLSRNADSAMLGVARNGAARGAVGAAHPGLTTTVVEATMIADSTLVLRFYPFCNGVEGHH
jgi:hypothetical protein